MKRSEASEAPCGLSLIEVAEGIRKKEYSSLEVVSACLERVDRSQQAWNAFIHVEHEQALAGARRADETLSRGESSGALHGVPVAHKDTYFRQGRLATCGSRIHAEFRPDRTATTIDRLDRAGAIDLGGVNTSDSGCNPFGLNVLVGRARNPWDPDRVTGGSSSGSAAAVAGGLVYASMGSDSGGSIRLPASMCGAVGLKPTEGLISRYGILPLSDTLDCSGPLTRTVADCALVTGVVAGFDRLDGASFQHDVPAYLDDLERSMSGRRVGIPSNYFWEGLDSEVELVLAASREVFRAEGAEIVELPVPDPAPMDVMGNVIIFAEGARVHKKWLRDHADLYTPVTRHALEYGLCCPATRYIEALACRAPALAEYRERVFSRVDALLTPTLSGCAPKMSDVDRYLENQSRLPLDLARNTKPANFMGIPALTVPCGRSPDGMPVSFQLIGPPFSEPLLFNLGHIFQKATWRSRQLPEL